MLYSNPFDAAHENLTKGRGTSEQWFTHSTELVIPKAKTRVRFDAIEIAERNKQTVSTAVLAGFVDRSTLVEEPVRCETRLRSNEARKNAMKFREQADRWYDFEGNMHFHPSPKPPRIGAGQEAEVRLRCSSL